MRVVRRTAEYEKHEQRCKDDETPCCVCGRGIKNAKAAGMIHMHNGGWYAVTETEAAKLKVTMPGGDLGFWPIGADCLRRHPELKPYVQQNV